MVTIFFFQVLTSQRIYIKNVLNTQDASNLKNPQPYHALKFHVYLKLIFLNIGISGTVRTKHGHPVGHERDDSGMR